VDKKRLVPWGTLIATPGDFYEAEYFPEGFTWRGKPPSHFINSQCQAVLSHWRQRTSEQKIPFKLIGEYTIDVPRQRRQLRADEVDFFEEDVQGKCVSCFS
jgi:hypothetical protein